MLSILSMQKGEFSHCPRSAEFTLSFCWQSHVGRDETIACFEVAEDCNESDGTVGVCTRHFCCTPLILQNTISPCVALPAKILKRPRKTLYRKVEVLQRDWRQWCAAMTELKQARCWTSSFTFISSFNVKHWREVYSFTHFWALCTGCSLWKLKYGTCGAPKTFAKPLFGSLELLDLKHKTCDRTSPTGLLCTAKPCFRMEDEATSLGLCVKNLNRGSPTEKLRTSQWLLTAFFWDDGTSVP